MIKHKFYLRSTRTNASGCSALYFLINTQPKAWVATGVFISAEHWHQAKQLLKASPDYHRVSSQLNLLKTKADDYLHKLQVEKRSFNKEEFTRAVITGDLQSAFDPYLVDFIKEYTEVNNLSFGRYRHYSVLISNLQSFSPGARLNALTFEFAKRFEKWLVKSGNSINTIANKIKMLKALVHYAEHKKMLKEDPLKFMRVSVRKVRRAALVPGELLQLQDYFDTAELSGYRREVLRTFLFSCYTGLRYSDIKQLTHKKIINGSLQLRTEKTDTPVSVFLIPQAKALINTDIGKCFTVYTNEATNRALKVIAADAGINKALTFHVARHTFATISLRLGIGIKTVSEILGHSSVKITEQYLHLVDDTKEQELKKWATLTA